MLDAMTLRTGLNKRTVWIYKHPHGFGVCSRLAARVDGQQLAQTLVEAQAIAERMLVEKRAEPPIRYESGVL